nr:MAG: RNA-dependent RNA polymerase [Guiyang narna-like virus 1]
MDRRTRSTSRKAVGNDPDGRVSAAKLCYHAFVASILAVTGRLPLLSWREAKSFHSLARWFARTSNKSGPSHLAARLKEFAAEARVSALKQTSCPRTRFHRVFTGPLAFIRRALDSPDEPGRFDLLCQLSYLGRALPKARNSASGPPAHEGEKALRAHLRDLTTPAAPLDEKDRTFLVSFAKRWSERHLSAFKPDFSFSLSGGSCVESTRRQGGLAAYLNRVVADEVAQPALIRHVKRLIPGLDNLEAVERAASGLLLPALGKRLPEVPVAIPVAIPERGWKMRIATKSNGSVVLLTHLFRQWVSRGIRSDPAIQEVLAGDHRAAIESLVGRFKNGLPLDYTVLSADLKTATDLISREAYQAIWEGILDSEPGKTLPTEVRRAVELALSPQRLSYNFREGSVSATSVRGALMGLPSTWSFLCLINLAAWTQANRKCGRRSPLPVRICGDDLTALGPSKVHRAYEASMRRWGAKFSGFSKHIEARLGGNFTEELFRLEPQTATATSRIVEVIPVVTSPRSRPPGALPDWEIAALRAAFPEELPAAPSVKWTDAFPLRGILGTMKSASLGLEAPYWVTLGPAIQGLIEDRNPGARQKILKVVRFAHPDLFRLAHETGLSTVIHLPRLVGGFGIPRPTGPMFDPLPDNVFGRAAAALALGAGWDAKIDVLSQAYAAQIRDSVPIRRVAQVSAEAQVEDRIVLARPSAETPVGYVSSPLQYEEVVEAATNRLANATAALVSPEALRPPGDLPSSRNPKILRRLRGELYRNCKAVLRQFGGALRAVRSGLPRTALVEEKLEGIRANRRTFVREADVPILLPRGIRPRPPPTLQALLLGKGRVVPPKTEHIHLIALADLEQFPELRAQTEQHGTGSARGGTPRQPVSQTARRRL